MASTRKAVSTFTSFKGIPEHSRAWGQALAFRGCGFRRCGARPSIVNVNLRKPGVLFFEGPRASLRLFGNRMSSFDTSIISPPALASGIRTGLRLIHFGGLVLGFGGAVFLDLMLSRHRKIPVTAELAGNVGWISRFVAFGLAMLWTSGIGFLILYQFTEPEKLMNPKIWAKVTIVAILTLNGVAIHRFVLPYVERRIGRLLLGDLQPRKRAALIGCGVVSIVSWAMPVVLGAAPQLNFVVPCVAILAAYAAVLAQAFLVAIFIMRSPGEAAAQAAGFGDGAMTETIR